MNLINSGPKTLNFPNDLNYQSTTHLLESFEFRGLKTARRKLRFSREWRKLKKLTSFFVFKHI